MMKSINFSGAHFEVFLWHGDVRSLILFLITHTQEKTSSKSDSLKNYSVSKQHEECVHSLDLKNLPYFVAEKLFFASLVMKLHNKELMRSLWGHTWMCHLSFGNEMKEWHELQNFSGINALFLSRKLLWWDFASTAFERSSFQFLGSPLIYSKLDDYKRVQN